MAISPYQFTPYGGRTVLFLAQEDANKRAPLRFFPRSGWGKKMLPQLEVFQVPGTHVTMIRPPHVEVLAKRLDACLNDTTPTF